MSFWVQHGYGKGDKIARLIEDERITGGVLLSPGDEPAHALRATAELLRGEDIRTLMDPQFYVYSIEGGAARCHDEHGLDFGALSWFLSPTEMNGHVERILRVNRDLGLQECIAPGPYQASFNDRWTPVSLQYAQAFVQASDVRTFISVVAEDAAFADWRATQAWLDAITTVDAHGIYLIVSHSGATYPHIWNVERLTNVLRVIYALAELNEYELIWGYSDVAGLVGLAAGASGAATGWFHSLRLWSPQKWVPRSGGRQANPRVFSVPALSPLDLSSEAVGAVRTAHAQRVFPNRILRRRLTQDPDSFGISDAWYQHMTSLSRVLARVPSDASVDERVEDVDAQLGGAVDLLADLVTAGVPVAAAHTTRLNALRSALANFAEAEDL